MFSHLTRISGDIIPPPQAPPRRNRMDRLLKRAQSNLEAKFRRDRGGTAGSSDPNGGSQGDNSSPKLPGNDGNNTQTTTEQHVPKIMTAPGGQRRRTPEPTMAEGATAHVPKIMSGIRRRGTDLSSPIPKMMPLGESGGGRSGEGISRNMPLKAPPPAASLAGGGNAPIKTPSPAASPVTGGNTPIKAQPPDNGGNVHVPKIMRPMRAGDTSQQSSHLVGKPPDISKLPTKMAGDTDSSSMGHVPKMMQSTGVGGAAPRRRRERNANSGVNQSGGILVEGNLTQQQPGVHVARNGVTNNGGYCDLIYYD